ncbi:MAG: NERD domain-containing protein [Planctomycetia bacterium]|nr:NERD domain-containing protein [Planctomycetia bacterium]
MRQQFPTHEPYRAWSNFEFIADDGSINEVDLLVFTSRGFFLVEIKSRPGVLTGNTHTWTWQHEGHFKVVDNPVFLANQKAKKLASLLQRQRAFVKLRVPFIEPLIFCSAENLQSQLQGNARFHVCLRDQANATTWKVIIDYPFDEPGHTTRDDLGKLQIYSSVTNPSD